MIIRISTGALPLVFIGFILFMVIADRVYWHLWRYYHALRFKKNAMRMYKNSYTSEKEVK